jgi:hypothetical protein
MEEKLVATHYHQNQIFGKHYWQVIYQGLEYTPLGCSIGGLIAV